MVGTSNLGSWNGNWFGISFIHQKFDDVLITWKCSSSELSLVGAWATPLKNMKVNGKDYPIYEMENKKCLKTPTRSGYITIVIGVPYPDNHVGLVHPGSTHETNLNCSLK